MLKRLLLFFFKKTIWDIHCTWDHEQAEAEERALYGDNLPMSDNEVDCIVEDDYYPAPECEVCGFHESVTVQFGKYVCHECFREEQPAPKEVAVSMLHSEMGRVEVVFDAGRRVLVPINDKYFNGDNPLFLKEDNTLAEGWYFFGDTILCYNKSN